MEVLSSPNHGERIAAKAIAGRLNHGQRRGSGGIYGVPPEGAFHSSAAGQGLAGATMPCLLPRASPEFTGTPI